MLDRKSFKTIIDNDAVCLFGTNRNFLEEKCKVISQYSQVVYPSTKIQEFTISPCKSKKILEDDFYYWDMPSDPSYISLRKSVKSLYQQLSMSNNSNDETLRSVYQRISGRLPISMVRAIESESVILGVRGLTTNTIAARLGITLTLEQSSLEKKDDLMSAVVTTQDGGPQATRSSDTLSQDRVISVTI